MCTPTIPRMSVPRDFASLSEPRYGIFSVATVIDDMDPHAYQGIQYTALCDPHVRPYPAPGCSPGTPQDNPTKHGDRTTSVVTADPFVLYAVETCPPLGTSPDQARDRLRTRITRGEPHMVEYVINNGLVGARPYLRDPDAVVLADGEPVDIVQAIGRLEQHLALIGRVGAIHVPRWLAPRLDHLGVIRRQGPQAHTFLGTRVVFGSGYDGRGPDGTADTDTWLYATATPTVRRSHIIEPATWQTGGFDTRTNQGFLVAERVYVVDWPCPVASIRTNVARPDGLIPPDPVVPPALAVEPDTGESPLDVVATVDNHGNGSVELDWGDGSDPVTVDDGATVGHTYDTAGVYTVTATSQTDPHPITSTVVVVTAPVPPASDVGADDITPTSATATWAWDGDPSTIDGFAVRYRTSPDGAWSSPAIIASSERTLALTGLFPSTAYDVSVSVLTDSAPPDDAVGTFTTADVPAPTVVATPDSGTTPLSVQVTVDAHGMGPVTIDPGDDSGLVTNPGDGTTVTEHTYTDPGEYTITAAPASTPDATGTATVTASAPVLAPAFDVIVDGSSPVALDAAWEWQAPDADAPTPTTFSIAYRVDGDTDWTDADPVNGDARATAIDGLTPSTTYDVRVIAANDTLTAEPAIGSGPTAAHVAPVVTATPDEGDAPLNVVFVVDNHGNGPVELTFGDGADPATNPGDGTTETAHTYTDPDAYTATATSQLWSGATGTVDVTVTVPAPTTIDAPTEPATSAPTPTTLDVEWQWEQGEGLDATGFTVASRESGTQQWSTPVAAGADDRTVLLAELTPGTTYDVQVIAVAGEVESDPATTTGTTAEHPDPVITATPDDGDAPLGVVFVVDNHGHGPADVDFGDGTDPVTNPGDGSSQTAYTFVEAGEYTATATSQLWSGAAGSTDVTVTAPAPTTIDAPTAPAASESSPTALDVAWQWEQGGGLNATGFTVASRESGTEEWSTPTTTDASTRTVVLDGLSPSTTYDVRVVAVAGEVVSDPATTTGTTGDHPDPVVAISPTTGDAPLDVAVTVDNHGHGPVDLAFGDGSDPVTNPGDGSTTTPHTYADAGEHTVTATSQAWPGAVGTGQITVN